jgi:hypothetical protein
MSVAVLEELIACKSRCEVVCIRIAAVPQVGLK